MYKRIKKIIEAEYPVSVILYRMFEKKNGNSFLKRIENASKNKTPLERVKAIAYDGFSQNTHPSVVWYGGKYYMAATPFPYSDSKKENPCIYSSDNGIEFKSNDGMPLAVPAKNSYLSDPELIFENGTADLYYRAHVNVTKHAIIYKMSSADFYVWSSPVKICETDESFLSPSVVCDGERRYFYVVNKKDNVMILERFQEENSQLTSKQSIEITNPPADMNLWHIDIEKINGKFVGIFTFAEDFNGNRCKIHYAEGNGDGTKWEIVRKIDVCTDESKYFRNIYKSSIVDVDGKKIIYFSAMNRKMEWHIYRIGLEE